MASYLDTIPKQLATRRKACDAALSNPALLSGCWTVIRTIATNILDYMRTTVVTGCAFPDRPIQLSHEEVCFLNFGTTPSILAQDYQLWRREDESDATPLEDLVSVPDEYQKEYAQRLRQMIQLYATDHQESRVWNLEPWIQDRYRDELNVDNAEHLYRQIGEVHSFMDTVPKALVATGLPDKLARGVLDAFILFRTITGSAHQLDRIKASFTDKRGYVGTAIKIEKVLALADATLGATTRGRSAVRELFDTWKDANYRLMELSRQLRELWAGSSLEDRVAEVDRLFRAVCLTLLRIAEEDEEPFPQLPAITVDLPNDDPVDRKTLTHCFRLVEMFSPFQAQLSAAAAREMRRFGPLSLLIVPGHGKPRFSAELRWVMEKRLHTTKVAPADEELLRRITYPHNAIVVPVECPRSSMLEDLSFAWLEYHQRAFPETYKEMSEKFRNTLSKGIPRGSGLPHENTAHRFMKYTARAYAGFCRWAATGQEAVAGMPAHDVIQFRNLMLERLAPAEFVIPLAYRPTLSVFSDANARRRLELWRHYLGPRYNLDCQLVATAILQKNWPEFKSILKYLPRSMTANNLSLQSGFARIKDTADPIAGYKALNHFRRFLMEETDLRQALITVESRMAAETGALRYQTDAFGKQFQYDTAMKSILTQQTSHLHEMRNRANAHIDQHLTGLMYALDGNLEAAEGALVMCLIPAERRPVSAATGVVHESDSEQEWFANAMTAMSNSFAKTPVPGEDGIGTVCYDYIYYNLGIVYMKMGRTVEALLSFRAAKELYPADRFHLLNLWMDDLRKKLAMNRPQ